MKKQYTTAQLLNQPRETFNTITQNGTTVILSVDDDLILNSSNSESIPSRYPKR